MQIPPARPLYLADGEEQFFVVYQPSSGGEPRPALLFCPPFGWDEVCSYRVIRDWARRASLDGHESLRLSLPSTGDSVGSPHDPGRVDAWTRSIDAAARWLRSTAGASSVIGIGLGLGGALACRAASLGAPIDGLVLWATPAHVRDLTRELKAFSRMERSEFFVDLESPPALEDGMEAGGFLLSGETVRELSALDLTASNLTGRLAAGALVLDRDGLPADDALLAALRRDGIDVTTAPGDGYAQMTSHPQRATAPEDTIMTVRQWLATRPDTTVPTPPPSATERACAEYEVDGRWIVETPLTVDRPDSRLSAILTTAAGELVPVCVVLLNAGGVRRIGPNRMWVEAARRWAARGVPSLRLDVTGIGEADGATTPYADDGALYSPELVPDVIAALDELERRGVAERFVLGGLCAGAYWSLYAGLDDARVEAMVLLNPAALVWDPELGTSRELRRAATQWSWEKVRKGITAERLRVLLAIGVSAVRRAVGQVRASTGGPPSVDAQIDATLERVRRTDKPLSIIFAAREPLAQELRRSGRMARLESWPNVTVQSIPVNDHTFRPVRIQTHVHAALDDALRRQLEQPPVPRPTAAAPS